MKVNEAVCSSVQRSPPQQNSRALEWYRLHHGSCIQTLDMAIVTLSFKLLRFLSPAHSGDLLQSVILIFIFMGAMAGSFQPKYQTQDLNGPRKTVEIDNHFYGSIVSRTHIHRVLHAEPHHLGRKSSVAMPWTTMFSLLVLMFMISVPWEHTSLSGETSRAPSANAPYSTSISRTQFVPSPRFLCFVSGIVPFCAIYMDLFFNYVTQVPLYSTTWRLAAIGHRDLHVHECRGWICCSQGITIWNSEKQEYSEKLVIYLTALLFHGITFIIFFMLYLLI